MAAPQRCHACFHTEAWALGTGGPTQPHAPFQAPPCLPQPWDASLTHHDGPRPCDAPHRDTMPPLHLRCPRAHRAPASRLLRAGPGDLLTQLRPLPPLPSTLPGALTSWAPSSAPHPPTPGLGSPARPPAPCSWHPTLSGTNGVAGNPAGNEGMAQWRTAPWGAEEPHTVCLLDPCCLAGLTGARS